MLFLIFLAVSTTQSTNPWGKLSHPRTNRGNLKISVLKQEVVCRASINYQKNFTALAWATAFFDLKTKELVHS